MAVGHKILIISYHILSGNIEYRELGGNYFDERDKAEVVKRISRRLEALGYTVVKQAAA